MAKEKGTGVASGPTIEYKLPKASAPHLQRLTQDAQVATDRISAFLHATALALGLDPDTHMFDFQTLTFKLKTE